MPRSVRFAYDVPGTPKQVAQRLKAHTRFRPFPHQSSPLGRGELGGRVGTRSFAVADDAPVFVGTARAVAQGTLRDNGDGTTHVEGSIGMPAWVTWTLRLATLLTPVILFAGAGAVWAEEPTLAAILLAVVLLAAPVLIFSVGRQVADADAGVDDLDQRLRATLIGSEPSATSEHQEHERAARAHAAAQATRVH